MSELDYKNVKVTFIIPKDCQDETETIQQMQDAYELCRQNVMQTSWIHEEDSEEINLVKTNFLIFQRFEGEFYEKVINSKSVRVLGPFCLLSCLTNTKPIPNVDWPLMNLALEGCIVACSNLSKAQKQEVRFKIQAMGGLYTPTLVAANTHLVTETVQSEKYYKAAPLGLKIMLPSWIDAVWSASQTAEVNGCSEEFDRHKCPPFHNLTICTTGFTCSAEKETLQNAIVNNGGTFIKQLVLKKTEVLVCKGSSSDKYKAARKNDILCVSIDWIMDSVEKGYAIPDVNKYLVKKGTSTPTKQLALDEPNFSMMSAIGGSTLSGQSVLQETLNATNISTASFKPQAKKGKSPYKGGKLIDRLDVKMVKRAGAFLDGCSIYLVGFTAEHREKLCKVLNFSGATRYDNLSERITHVIVGDCACQEMRVIQSKNYPCALVSVHWLIDSIDQQQPVNESEYLLMTNRTVREDHNSPLSKKGLRLLKADVTLMEMESAEKPAPPPDISVQPEDDIMMQYLQPATNTNQEDTLAAVLAANRFDTMQQQNTSENSKAAPQQSTCLSQSISISMNETGSPLFKNLKFLIANFPQDELENISSAIKDLGGTVVPKTYKGIPDYAVLPICSNNLRQTATEIITDIWISECFENQSLTEVLYYHKPITLEQCDLLSGCVITMSGIFKFERIYLKKLCEVLGAVVQDSFSRICKPDKGILISTHLISAEECGKKYEAAIKWRLPVLYKEWIIDCAKTERKLDVFDYLIGDSKENFSRDQSTVLNETTNRTNQKPSFNESLQTNKAKNSQKVNNSTNKQNFTPPMTKRRLISVSKTPGTSSNPDNSLSNVSTPVQQHNIPDDQQTPENTGSPYCSQITPVNQIMQQAWNDMDINVPVTPKPWNYVETPTSPLGAFICHDPPPELRKKFARWINQFPDYITKDKTMSTPLSEIKRKLWNKICPKVTKVQAPDFNVEEEEPNTSRASMENPTDVIPAEDANETPENCVVNEKLQKLQDMLMASGGSRRSSTRKLDPPIPVEAYHEKESQPGSVGWDENIETLFKKSFLFIITGVDSEERDEIVEKIEKLGGQVSDLQNFDPACTHLVCKKLIRSEKLLASMASGKWILHISFVEDSFKAGKFLNEELYEFGNPKCGIPIDREAEQRANSIYYWRKEISRRGYKAFNDVKAIVVANKKDPIVRVIEAGGGMVVNLEPPFEGNIFATHCLLEVKSVKDFKDYVPLAEQGIFCVNTLYVHDFLNRNVKDIRDCILPNFVKYY